MTRTTWALAGAGLAVVASGCGLWYARRPKPLPPAGLVYTPSGFGGYVAPAPKPSAPAKPDPLRPALEAYSARRYAEAEKLVQPLTAAARPSSGPAARRLAARAGMVYAFSAARQQRLADARARFASVRYLAARLPAAPATPGRPPGPTIEENAAFQHAVCTAALGNTKAAEAEYLALMRDYPESTVVAAAMMRIRRMHGGNTTPEAETVWKQARATARKRDLARQRDRSLCGPECLAELLRRRTGRSGPTVRALAQAMRTTHEGTSMADLTRVAGAHGWPCRGLRLTWKGLLRQKLPLIALVAPAHFVIVQSAGGGGVEAWDPDGGGPGKSRARRYTESEWQRRWHGVALVSDRGTPTEM